MARQSVLLRTKPERSCEDPGRQIQQNTSQCDRTAQCRQKDCSDNAASRKSTRRIVYLQCSQVFQMRALLLPHSQAVLAHHQFQNQYCRALPLPQSYPLLAWRCRHGDGRRHMSRGRCLWEQFLWFSAFLPTCKHYHRGVRFTKRCSV